MCIRDSNLIDYAVEEYCGNRNQTYAIGYSLGSMFTYELACHMSNKFVSIASYAGSMPINPNSCDVDESINIMHIHGKNDAIIPYYDTWEWKNWDSVGSMMDTESLIEFWGNKNSCLSKSTSNFSCAYASSWALVIELKLDSSTFFTSFLTGAAFSTRWPAAIILSLRPR